MRFPSDTDLFLAQDSWIVSFFLNYLSHWMSYIILTLISHNKRAWYSNEAISDFIQSIIWNNLPPNKADMIFQFRRLEMCPNFSHRLIHAPNWHRCWASPARILGYFGAQVICVPLCDYFTEPRWVIIERLWTPIECMANFFGLFFK